MLEIENCSLVVVDVQGKLAQIMYEKEVLFKNIQILIKAANILNIPILWCQQVPKALGPTIPEISELLPDVEPINKASFSCCSEEQFNNKLNKLNVEQVLICGIETHICVYQTALDLHKKGFDVNVVADAVSSRTLENKTIALERMAHESCKIGSVEMALFELLKTAEHPNFKEIARLIK
ncbi:MAG: hydrolase [Sedimentisphaerales bacterium]|nr:hydrolase [Sedimentisphaerales bacterium]